MNYPQPKLRPDPATGMMILTDAFVARLPRSRALLHIAAGYPYNGFSAPRAVWTLTGLTPYRPDLCRGGLGHDGICQAQLPGWTPNNARAELLALLQQDGVPHLDIEETDLGLLIGGWKCWDDDADPALIAAARKFVTIE
jgi:hypothetical protein